MQYLLSFLIALTGLVTANFNIDTTPNAVGIGYSVWHSIGYNGGNPPDIQDIENGQGSYAGQGVFHYWGLPAGNYYAGGDRSVLDRHFQQISGAGIDFIVIDATNLQGYGGYQVGLFTEPTDVLMDEMLLQRNAGKPTPSVVYWVRSESTDADPSAVIRYVRDHYHHNASYSDLFVTLDSKPLIITTHEQPSEFTDEFTLRQMWGLQQLTGDGQWSFLEDYPQTVANFSGAPEEVTVCVAKQASYMSDKSTATGRAQGKTYQQQWSRAFDVHPKVVMLTWWNEWMAQRQPDAADGSVQFVDEFDSEYSRDIEPQDPNQNGTHGSHFLDWTTQYIQAYKANQPQTSGLTGY